MFGFINEITKPAQKVLSDAGKQATAQFQRDLAQGTQQLTQAAQKYAQEQASKYIQQGVASFLSTASTEAAPAAESAATDV